MGDGDKRNLCAYRHSELPFRGVIATFFSTRIHIRRKWQFFLLLYLKSEEEGEEEEEKQKEREERGGQLILT